MNMSNEESWRRAAFWKLFGPEPPLIQPTFSSLWSALVTMDSSSSLHDLNLTPERKGRQGWKRVVGVVWVVEEIRLGTGRVCGAPSLCRGAIHLEFMGRVECQLLLSQRWVIVYSPEETEKKPRRITPPLCVCAQESASYVIEDKRSDIFMHVRVCGQY